MVLFYISYPLLLITGVSGAYIASYFLKHLYYPRVRLYIRGSNRYIGFSSKIARFNVLLVVLFLVGNAACLRIGVRNIASLTKRSGMLCIINIVPLVLGERINLVASFCGVRLRTYTSIHEWLGAVVIAEGLIHSVTALSSQHLSLQSTFGVAELIVSYLHLLNFISLKGLKAAAAGVLLLLSSLA